MKVSVIIPVYNCETTLETTVESIINQNFKDFEIILINDYSTDGSDRICKTLCEKDQRIKYIVNTKNSGPAITRNRGIDIARGEYLAFVDSDDIVKDSYLATLVSKADKDGADIVWCNFEIWNKLNDCRVSINHNLKGVLGLKDYLTCFTDDIKFMGVGSLWNKLYKREFIDSNELRLNPKRVYGEDWDFNLRSSLKNPRIVATDEVLYTYIKYPHQHSSVSKRYYSADFESYNESLSMLENMVKEYRLEVSLRTLRNKYVYNIISLLYKLYHSEEEKDVKSSEFNRIIYSEDFKNILRTTSLKNPYLTIRQKITLFTIKAGLPFLSRKILSL